MNHQKIYESIIQKAKSENRMKLKKTDTNYVYYDNHHILPKCLNGGNEKENMQLLTAKEHIVCHKLLTYIHKGNRKLACAYHKMAFSKKTGLHISARDYAYARELFSTTPVSEETRNKQSKAKKGKKLTVEHRQNIGKAEKGKKKKPFSKEHKQNIHKSLEGKKHTKEHNQNISKGLTGKTCSEETKKKLSNSHKGKTTWMKGKHHTKESKEKNRLSKIGKSISDEHKKNIGRGISGENNGMHGKFGKDNPNFGSKRKRIVCEYCGKEMAINIYHGYHGDKCKNKK